MDFKIEVEDGSDTLSEFVVEQNTSFIELYDWQRRAIKYFFKFNKAIFEVTTGAGKTFCAIEIMKKIWETEPNVRVLIVVPKNVILETGWYKELYECGISLKDIGVFYGAIKEYAKVTITNMQSLHRIALELFDMIIFDEIHNYGTKRLLPYVERDFKYKLGLSATVERMDDQHWTIMKYFDYNVFKYIPEDALRDGVLNPFDFTNISVDMEPKDFDEYLRLTKEINIIMQIGGSFSAIMRSGSGLKYRMLSKMSERKMLVSNYPAKFGVLKQIIDKHRKDKIIVFNSFNEQTNKCYWYLLELGVKTCIMHSGISKEKRDANLIGFKRDKYNVVLTSKVLDEGYNLPKIDVGIIMAGDSTSRQTVQRAGRVLRKKTKSSNIYQIYCKNTIEEQYAMKRSILFKNLCTNYYQYVNNLGEE